MVSSQLLAFGTSIITSVITAIIVSIILGLLFKERKICTCICPNKSVNRIK
jgi:hypothetical protein